MKKNICSKILTDLSLYIIYIIDIIYFDTLFQILFVYLFMQKTKLGRWQTTPTINIHNLREMRTFDTPVKSENCIQSTYSSQLKLFFFMMRE